MTPESNKVALQFVESIVPALALFTAYSTLDPLWAIEVYLKYTLIYREVTHTGSSCLYVRWFETSRCLVDHKATGGALDALDTRCACVEQSRLPLHMFRQCTVDDCRKSDRVGTDRKELAPLTGFRQTNDSACLRLRVYIDSRFSRELIIIWWPSSTIPNTSTRSS